MILGERYQPGIGKCTLQQFYEREIIHLLYFENKSFADIKEAIPHASYKEIKEALDRVSDLVIFTDLANVTTKKYKLKEAFVDQINPFYYHYSSQQYNQAEYLRRERASTSITSCLPPKAPEFEDNFKPILRIFKHPLFIQLLFNAIDRYDQRNEFSSGRLLHRAMFLMAMALEEELNGSLKHLTNEPSFSQQAESLGIFKLLGSDFESKNKTLIILSQWIMEKFDELKNPQRISLQDVIMQE
uniref:E3 ubiquitin-protein ligase n=1 Tax=Panagrolaimus davidi TaxID=227884 RepID=A0A914Q529_9BILA